MAKRTKSPINEQKFIKFVGVIALCVCLIGFLGVRFLSKKKQTISEYAEHIIKICAEKPTRAQLCYDSEIENLSREIPMEDAFAIMKVIQVEDKNSKLINCHTLGHQIARQEIRKNTSDWKQVFAR